MIENLLDEEYNTIQDDVSKSKEEVVDNVTEFKSE